MTRLTTLLACVVVLACGGGRTSGPSNTGYTGTWTRGTDANRSTLYIVHDAGGAWFRWSQYTENASFNVECEGWTGRCEQFEGPRRSGMHQFRIWENPGTGHLMVQCDSEFTAAPQQTHSYIDELVLAEDGLKLFSYTVEVNGTPVEEGRRASRAFKKLSDEVPDPPSRQADSS